MNPTIPPPEHEIRRSGFKSSEFWLSLAAIAFASVLPMLSDAAAAVVEKSPYAALAPAIVAAGYAVSRGLVKKSRNDASAVAATPTSSEGVRALAPFVGAVSSLSTSDFIATEDGHAGGVQDEEADQ